MANLNEVKMTIGASIVLNKVLTLILFTDPNPDKPIERSLPMSVKYKLQRAKSLVEKDCIFFEQKRADLVKKYGVAEEGKEDTLTVPDDKMDAYRKDLLEVFQIEVSHEFLKMNPEDVSEINVEGVSTEEISLFMAILIKDDALEKDLLTPIEAPAETGEEKVKEGEEK